MDYRRNAEDAERARRIAEQALRRLPALAEAQRAAQRQERQREVAAAAGAITAIAPAIESIRQVALAYARWVETNRDTIELMAHGMSTALEVVAAQVRANPELAASLVRAAKLQAEMSRRSAVPTQDTVVDDDELRQVADELAGGEGFSDLVDVARERVDAGDAVVPEQMYGLGLELEEIYVFVAVYLALVTGLFLYEHPAAAVAVEKTREFFDFAVLFYLALSWHRSRDQ